jgi:predicted amidophosphoribosyltransferase
MSLIKCTECGQDISTEAPVCPHCGKPNLSIAPTSVAVKSTVPKKGTARVIV